MSRPQGAKSASSKQYAQIARLEACLKTLKTANDELPPLCKCMNFDREATITRIADKIMKALEREIKTGVQARLRPPVPRRNLYYPGQPVPKLRWGQQDM